MNDSICDVELQLALAQPQTRNAAATAIYERYSPDMRRVVKSRMQRQLANRLCLDDVMQSTWRSFHGCVDALRVTDSFWPYLYTILTRKLSRARTWHRAAKRDVGREENLGHILEQIVTGRTQPDIQWLREAATELEGFYRQIIELRMQGYSQPEIAEQLGKSIKFVQRYQKSAIVMLRAQLERDQAS